MTTLVPPCHLKLYYAGMLVPKRQAIDEAIAARSKAMNTGNMSPR